MLIDEGAMMRYKTVSKLDGGSMKKRQSSMIRVVECERMRSLMIALKAQVVRKVLMPSKLLLKWEGR